MNTIDYSADAQCPVCTSVNIRNTGVGRIDGSSGVIWKYQCLACAIEFKVRQTDFIKTKNKVKPIFQTNHKASHFSRFQMINTDKLLHDVEQAQSGIVAWYTQFKDKVYQHQFHLPQEINIGKENDGCYIQYCSLKYFFDEQTTRISRKHIDRSRKMYRIESDELLMIQIILHF